MMKYLRLLSHRQLLWGAGGLLLVSILIVSGLLAGGDREAVDESTFETTMSLKEIARKLGATGKAVARELGLSLDVSGKAPVAELGITEEALHETVHHLLGHRDTGLKYWLYAALVVWGWIFLVRIGRPDWGHVKKDRKSRYPRAVYTVTLIVAVVFAGFLLGKSPNPMEGAVKVFKSMVGLYPDALAKVLALAFFLGLAIVGNKLICGWGCPFGALQELLHSLPWLRKMKRKSKPPFWVMNLIRTVLFLVTLLVLFGVVSGKRGFVVYHLVNPFNLFNLEFETFSIILTVAASLILGLVIYRPFCQVICPFGFLSWLTERLSIYRVRIDHDRCDECGICDRACPSSAADGLVKRVAFPADCFSCARCLSVCPTDAIHYESVFSRTDRPVEETLRNPESDSQVSLSE